MASRLNKRQTQSAKDLIKTNQLVKRLQNHVDGEKNAKDMTLSQVNAAKFLIGLVLPSLKGVEQSVDMTVNIPKSISFKVKK